MSNNFKNWFYLEVLRKEKRENERDKQTCRDRQIERDRERYAPDKNLPFPK